MKHSNPGQAVCSIWWWWDEYNDSQQFVLLKEKSEVLKLLFHTVDLFTVLKV